MQKNGNIILKFLFFLKNYKEICRILCEVYTMSDESKKALSKERKKEIDSIVDGIRIKYKLNPLEFNLAEFLTEKVDFFIGTATLNNSTTGMLFVDDNNKLPNTNKNRVIIINDLRKDENDFDRRARFITAHEYAHFVLHKNSESQIAFRDNGNYETIEEQEAEYFARSLLMPEKIINASFENDKNHSLSQDLITKVADFFYVTPKKAKQRLLELGYGE